MKAVALAHVRKLFVALYPAEGEDQGKRADAKRKAFNRAAASATARDLIGSVELQGQDHVWLKAPED